MAARRELGLRCRDGLGGWVLRGDVRILGAAAVRIVDVVAIVAALVLLLGVVFAAHWFLRMIFE